MTESPATPLENLQRLFDQGLMDRATFEAASAGIRAQLAGPGAIAQGTAALAVGAGGVGIAGNNSGLINLGVLNVLIQQGSRPGASAQALRQAYLATVVTQANQLPLVAADGGATQARLSAVYTALLTRRIKADDAVQALQDRQDARHLSALEMLNAERKLVLLGGPGSGKSSFANIVALSMAGELLGLPEPNLARLTAPVPDTESKRDEAPKPQPWNRGALLPVPVLLRDLAAQLAPGTPVNADVLWQHLRRRLEQLALADFAPLLHQELLDKGGLILLDGLDEVPESHNRRALIKQAVQSFAGCFTHCRFLVTSRTYAYQRQDWKLDGFAEVQLLPFTLPQIHRFVAAWYAHMVELRRRTEADAEARTRELQHEVQRNPPLRELAERPLLLTLIVQLGAAPLPEKREALYDKAVEMLLDTWERMKPPTGNHEVDQQPSLSEYLHTSKERLRTQLNQLAFEAHRDQQQLVGSADIPQAALIAALLKASGPDAKPVRLEEYLRDRAGLLSAHGVGMYQFPHRSFQEYLAACHLTDDAYFPRQLVELVRADPNRWREVLLLAGAKAARGARHNAWLLGEALCFRMPGEAATDEAGRADPADRADQADHWAALLAGRVLVESADLAQVADHDKQKLDRIRHWQVAILRRGTLPLVERVRAGRTLATLGDPRPEVMTLAGMQFCLVPPGPFVMGSDDSHKYEAPQHTLDLPYLYFIARYPVTLAQRQEALQHCGGISRDERSLLRSGNDPVCYVNWHEAMEFCDALTQIWQEQLPQGFVVTLPSEAEWEKAARGGHQIPAKNQYLTLNQLALSMQPMPQAAPIDNPLPRRTYPWGDDFDSERANAAFVIDKLCTPGCCPKGASPYGCEDMGGNVWEWTRSLWGTNISTPEFPYPYQIDDPRRESREAEETIWRSTRGGPWDGMVEFSRYTCRVGAAVSRGRRALGFRVVLRSTTV